MMKNLTQLLPIIFCSILCLKGSDNLAQAFHELWTVQKEKGASSPELIAYLEELSREPSLVAAESKYSNIFSGVKYYFLVSERRDEGIEFDRPPFFLWPLPVSDLVLFEDAASSSRVLWIRMFLDKLADSKYINEDLYLQFYMVLADFEMMARSEKYSNSIYEISSIIDKNYSSIISVIGKSNNSPIDYDHNIPILLMEVGRSLLLKGNLPYDNFKNAMLYLNSIIVAEIINRDLINVDVEGGESMIVNKIKEQCGSPVAGEDPSLILENVAKMISEISFEDQMDSFDMKVFESIGLDSRISYGSIGDQELLRKYQILQSLAKIYSSQGSDCEMRMLIDPDVFLFFSRL